MNTTFRVNQKIRASEVRVIGPAGENFGVMSTHEAMARAREFGLDLIEVSPNVVPPITKITDYGKFLYNESKKQKQIKAKAKVSELKNLQIKMGTGEHDLNLKAKKAGVWLREGHKLRIDLFLTGRSKYMDQEFLKTRLDRILELIPEKFKITDPPKKSTKGLTIVIDKE